MRRAWRALRRFWESDRGLSVFLGLLVLFVFVLPPFVEPDGSDRGLIVDLGLSVLLLAGVAAVSTHRAVRALLFVLVVGALVVRWGPFAAPATAAAALVTVVAMTFLVLGQAFAGCGSIMLTAVTFANTTSSLNPTSMSANG